MQDIFYNIALEADPSLLAKLCQLNKRQYQAICHPLSRFWPAKIQYDFGQICDNTSDDECCIRMVGNNWKETYQFLHVEKVWKQRYYRDFIAPPFSDTWQDSYLIANQLIDDSPNMIWNQNIPVASRASYYNEIMLRHMLDILIGADLNLVYTVNNNHDINELYGQYVTPISMFVRPPEYLEIDPHVTHEDDDLLRDKWLEDGMDDLIEYLKQGNSLYIILMYAMNINVFKYVGQVDGQDLYRYVEIDIDEIPDGDEPPPPGAQSIVAKNVAEKEC